MKKNVTIFLFFLLEHLPMFGQITIQGTIIDQLGKPIDGVSVYLNCMEKGNVLTYSISDENGFYKMNYEGKQDSLQLTLSGFNYKKEFHRIANITQTINFSLKGEAIALKEVIVKAEPVSQRGDTVSYLVSSFSSDNDRVIGDVLKKMPGIKVLSNGAIQYNGKDINKFYIENLDLLQGRYNIATNNIAANNVASVEIFEYHQPVKALAETNPTDRAAINLKLKNNAKTLNAVAQLGIGTTPLLWENELILLYFAKNKQNITTYKGNNSGNNVYSEQTNLYEDSDNDRFQGKFLSVLAPIPPDIDEHRYLFNNINTANTNFLFLLPKEYEMTASVSYSHDIQKRKSTACSSFYLSDNDILTIDEQLDTRNQSNQANANIQITTNKDHFYLTNTFKFNADWNDDKGTALFPDTVNQQLETTACNLSNLLEMVKTLPDGNTIHFRSFNGFTQTPQRLTIRPGLYQDVLNEKTDFDGLFQNIVFKNFTSKASVSYSVTNKLIQNYTTGIDINNQKLDSYLQEFQRNNILIYPMADSLQNNLYRQKYRVYFNGEYLYNWMNFRFIASLSASYNLLSIDNSFVPDKEKSIKRFLFNPGFYILYDISRKWYLKASMETDNNWGDIQDAYTGYILQNYRLFNRNDGEIAENSIWRSVFSANYRNPIKALFADVHLIYEIHKSNRLKEQYLVGLLQMNNTLHQTVQSNTAGITGAISKNIYAWHTNISLSSNFYKISSSQMSQKKIIDYQQNILTVSPIVHAQLTSWIGINYIGIWNESKMHIQNGGLKYPALHSVSHRVIPYFSFLKKWNFSIVYEHYYNNSVLVNRSRAFIDANMTYKLKNIDLMLSWSNILNSNEYITSLFDGTSKYTHIYEIRPSQVLLTARFRLF